MVKLRKSIAVAISVVVVVMAGILAASATGPSGHRGSPAPKTPPSNLLSMERLAPDAVVASAAPTAQDMEFVGLSTGCRIFDTRVTVGPFTSGLSRDLSVRDAALPGQGGSSGGCGIPTRAISVDLSLSTPGGSPSGAGYVRVGPGGVEPVATVLQFLRSQGTSVTTTAPLAANDRMRIKVIGAATHLVGDVLGYWQPTLHGYMTVLGWGGSPGVISMEKHPVIPGDYYVNFDRPVDYCDVAATPMDATTRVLVNWIDVDTILFDTRALASTAEADGELTFVVEC